MDRFVIEENENAIQMQRLLQNVPASRRFLVVSHPEDRETALEIGREILGVRNAVILAAKDAGLREGGGKALLEGLHMAVFVVTEKFLRAPEDEPCRAALRETLAKPGLRVLLIQAEKGIEREFDRVVGPRQLLDRTADDYADKLRLYIEGYADPYFLIGSDEDREKREGLLRFRIFISYRQKDADFLERILAAIRACPALSDAAVWYDDSLVSGENYNEQIDRALLDADLVLFAVTDRFTEPGNYVLVNEYPRAVSEGKPMLPVLAEGTDEAAIRRSYPLLETLYPFGETEAWLEAVRRTGAALGKLGGELSAKELYLLACEYENGVRTAASPTAAVGLLRQAAQGGSPDAMAKLGEHYAAGAGVEQDGEKAVALHRDALRTYEKRLAEGPEPDLTKRGYAMAVYRIADELFKEYITAGKLEDAREMVRLEYLGQAEALKYGAYLIPVSAYMHEAMLHTAEGAWAEALACYDRAEKEIPLAEATDRPDGRGPEGTIYAKGTLMRLDLCFNRGHIHSGLALKGEEGHFGAAVRDLRAAMEQFLQFKTLSGLDEFLPSGRGLLPTTVRDLLSLAHAAEEKPDGMAEAQKIYAELCTQLGALLSAGGPPELLNLYGQALTDAAMAGRAVPDRDRLLEAYKEYAVLHEHFPEEGKYRQNLEMTANFLTLWPASADVLKRQGIRPGRGLWLPVELTPEDAARCFCYPGDIPEGEFGDVKGSFRVSGYRCPHCSRRLYKTVFPEGKDPRLPIAPDGRRYLEPARVFASPCGRFFAAPKGMRLTDGLFMQAILVFDGNDRAQAEEFSRWWDFFDARGDLLATRRE